MQQKWYRACKLIPHELVDRFTKPCIHYIIIIIIIIKEQIKVT